MDNVYLFYAKYFGIGKKNQPKASKAELKILYTNIIQEKKQITRK